MKLLEKDGITVEIITVQDEANLKKHGYKEPVEIPAPEETGEVKRGRKAKDTPPTEPPEKKDGE